MLGSLTYDLRNDSRVAQSLGLAYADECFAISATYSETTDPYSDLASEREIFLRVSLRTIADTRILLATRHLATMIRPKTTRSDENARGKPEFRQIGW